MGLAEKCLSPAIPSGHGRVGRGSYTSVSTLCTEPPLFFLLTHKSDVVFTYVPFPVSTGQINIQDFHHPGKRLPARQLPHPGKERLF